MRSADLFPIRSLMQPDIRKARASHRFGPPGKRHQWPHPPAVLGI